MRVATFVFALVLCLIFKLTGAEKVPASFINEKVQRTIDLEKFTVRESRVINISPASSSGKLAKGTFYYFRVETAANSNTTIASIQVTQSKETLAHVFVKSETGAHGLSNLYKVPLADPNTKQKLHIEIAFIGALEPFPKEIAQNERQLVVFEGNAYVPTDYVTNWQKTRLVLASSSIIKYSKDVSPVTKSGKSVTYGPYEKDVAPGSFASLYVHFENNAPFLTVTSLTREIWLSYWGNNLAVEEWYELKHSGAHLKGQFSRIDYSHNSVSHQKTAVIQSFEVAIPWRASDVYYRDDVGNVSTSRIIRDFATGSSRMELTPRFPLFGGWIYTWYHGFNVPLSDYLRRDPVTDKFVLQANFVEGIEDAPVKDFTLKIVLPEGAEDIETSFPFAVDSMESGGEQKIFTFVDTIGRPTVIVKKSNLVDEHSQLFQIAFKYPWINSLRKPIVLTVGFLCMFVVAMAVLRVNLSYNKALSKKSKG